MTISKDWEPFFSEEELQQLPTNKEYDLIRDAAMQRYVVGDYGDWISERMEKGWSRPQCERFLQKHEKRIERAFKQLGPSIDEMFDNWSAKQ